MNRWVVVGAVSMAIGVALGAFGTHALRETFDDKQLQWWHTAQEYQVWHGLALVLVGLLSSSRRVEPVGWLFLGGALVFSGSLYAMALTKATWLGAITPIGGACFIAGWLALAFAFKPTRDSHR